MRSRAVAAVLGLTLFGCHGDRGPSTPAVPVVASIVVDPSSETLHWVGATTQIDAVPLDAEGGNITATVTWTSSNPGVAEVAGGLVTARGVGSATIHAHAGDVSTPVSIAVVQDPASVTKISGDDQAADPGEALADPLVIEVRDQGGSLVPDARVFWTVLEGGGTLQPMAERTDAEGRLSATWQLGGAGAQRALVSSGTGSATFDAAFAGAFQLTALAPAVLIEGQEIVLTGAGFTPGIAANAVTVDGAPATVLSATSTELRFRVPQFDCRPPRTGGVVLTSSGRMGSLPARIEPDEAVANPTVGESVVVADNGCIQLPERAAGAEYLIGVFSKSLAPSTVTPASILVEAGDAPGAASLALPPAPVVHPPTRTSSPMQTDPLMERRALAKERLWDETERLFREHGFPQPAAAIASAAVVPDVGTTIDLFEGASCSFRRQVTGLVRHVGTHAIWVEDTENPEITFSDAQWAALDATFSAHTMPTLVANFGMFSDLDANGRIIVLITRGVNEEGNILGYVWSGDFFPPAGCTQTNEAEIFFGIAPDPQGSLGGLEFTAQELLELYPSLITHEAAHLVQLTHPLHKKERWELEGGATLAEQLVGMSATGHGESANLGHAQWTAGDQWYDSWANDLAFYQGFSNGGKVANAPELCTWIGTAADGNDGPCLSRSRAIYGVPSMLLRYVLDAWGPQYPGGSQALMRAITASEDGGTQAIAGVAGVDENTLLARFYMALWADGRVGEWYTSWDVFDVFESLPAAARLVPYTSGGGDVELDLFVRAGSNGYLHWTPGAHAPTAVRARGAGGSLLPPEMVFWILRAG